MITSVKQFGVYQVGNQIQFWHQLDRRWTKGRITQIKHWDNYFVCVRIQYYKDKSPLETEIFREDWLKNAVEQIKP